MTAHRLIQSNRAVPALAALTLLVTILAGLWAVGAFAPARLPIGFSSRQQLLGIGVLLVLIPPYLLFAWGTLQRRTHALLGQVDELVPEPRFQRRAMPPPGVLLGGALAGTAYAVAFNLPVDSLQTLLSGGPLQAALVFCMILVWVCVGAALAGRLHTSGVFLSAGREVPLDLYDQQPIEPFAREGMGDLLMIAGALVLSTVQSIDATFRYENYMYALIVAVPAAALLLVRPMWSVHQGLRQHKREELAALATLIRTAPRSLEPAAMARLELLLHRRSRVQEAPTWPINVAMVTRMILYGVLPPAAWIAAALVERMLESMLGG